MALAIVADLVHPTNKKIKPQPKVKKKQIGKQLTSIEGAGDALPEEAFLPGRPRFDMREGEGEGEGARRYFYFLHFLSSFLPLSDVECQAYSWCCDWSVS